MILNENQMAELGRCCGSIKAIAVLLKIDECGETGVDAALRFLAKKNAIAYFDGFPKPKKGALLSREEAISYFAAVCRHAAKLVEEVA